MCVHPCVLCVCTPSVTASQQYYLPLCNVFHNVWPTGMEKEQELADCIDSEHLKLLFYSVVQEGLRGSPKPACFCDCFLLGCNFRS